MPLYEYSCIVCDTVTDIRHGFDEKNTEVCQKCGGELKRKFSASGIVFKGSGFYVNDSRTQSSPVASTPSETPPQAAAPAQDSQSSGDAGTSTPKVAAPAASPAAPANTSSSTPSAGNAA